MSVPWLSYLPIPGLSLVATWLDPEDPLTRYHAWQGGTLVIGSYVLIIALGFLLRISDAPAFQATIGLTSGLVLLGTLVGMVWGIVAASMKRYVRLRPVWDLLTAIRA